MQEWGIVNGELVPLEEKVILLEDRGHQFGDGVYEMTQVHNGQCFALEEHLDRLFRSLAAVRIMPPYSKEELREFHKRLLERSGISEGGIYLQITRGWSPRTHYFPETVQPSLSMTIRQMEFPEALKKSGIRLLLLPDQRWLRCDIKTLNLMANVLGIQQAKDEGYFAAVLERDGYITECVHSNFFAVKDGVIWTHPTNHLILKGVTRTMVVEKLAADLSISVKEEAFTPEFAFEADEVFITATILGVAPVIGINTHQIGTGAPGPITLQLQKGLQQMMKDQCGK